MAFKKPPSHLSTPDSPDKLFRDLPRRKHPSLFDHQGQMLRAYVQEALDKPDVALQLPTGSGKTLVGLLLAEWRRRKYREKIIFLCPTRQLVNQVAEEAATKYGLTVEPFTGAIKNYTPEAKAAYAAADRVAVTTYNSLFNINPFFKDPDIVIVDDAHASESYISSQWTLQVSRLEQDDTVLFAAIAGVLQQVLSDTNYTRLTGEWKSEPENPRHHRSQRPGQQAAALVRIRRNLALSHRKERPVHAGGQGGALSGNSVAHVPDELYRPHLRPGWIFP